MKAIGEAEFIERWRVQHAEWIEISDELAKTDPARSAWDVSHEQRKRAMRDGRTLVTCTPEGFYEITPAEDREMAERANA